MDESRKQFEQWFEWYTGFSPQTGSANLVEMYWQSWQASRAAIEIELPPAVDGSNFPFAGNVWNAYRAEAVEAIRAAGIKVKE